MNRTTAARKYLETNFPEAESAPSLLRNLSRKGPPPMGETHVRRRSRELSNPVSKKKIKIVEIQKKRKKQTNKQKRITKIEGEIVIDTCEA